jgi:hypothetical protein
MTEGGVRVAVLQIVARYKQMLCVNQCYIYAID